MDEKKYVKLVLLFMAIFTLIFSGAIVFIDPYFHYHAPVEGLAYRFDTPEERYVNDGIVKNFEYDAIIAGTSMIENFKTSECDELFGVKSVKVPLNGAYYKEVNTLLNNALKANPNIKCIFRSLDYTMLNVDKDTVREGGENFPTYLYDANPFNDVNYIFNKSVLVECVEVIQNTLNGMESTTFDEYANWSSEKMYGRGPILAWHVQLPKAAEEAVFTEELRTQVTENLVQNVESTLIEYPDVEFYLFFTPYSVYFWDNLYQMGELLQHIEMERLVIERLLQYDNVRLFSFANNFDVICDEYNYTDTAHYGGWINSDMLEWMAEGKYELTEENYEAYLSEIREYYSTYDYASMYIY